MGLFDLFSSSYKPKDFAGKTPEQIFTEVKLDKFSKSIKNVNDPEYMALDDQAKNAIDLLIDLKNGKLEIYKKCYSGESKPIAHMPPNMRSKMRCQVEHCRLTKPIVGSQ